MKTKYIPTLVATCLVVLATSLISATQAQTAAAPDQPVLWHIGQADGIDSDFSLGPSNWGHYTKDAIYVVGKSDPSSDWPYVQPGPDDQWAGSRVHTNDIFFGLSNVGTGMCNLSLHLIDSQDNYPPQLNVAVNGQAWSEQTVAGNGDDSLNGQPSMGKSSDIDISFPAVLLKKGVNSVTITTTTGSWIIYDAVNMTAPANTVLSDANDFATIESAEWLHDVLALKDGKYQQVLKVTTVNTGGPRKFDLFVSGEGTRSVVIPNGKSSVELLYPESDGYQLSSLSLSSPGSFSPIVFFAKREPCKRYTIYEIEESHMDIGYAYLQRQALDIHKKDIDDAFQQFAKTASYPKDSRFRWNCESLVETDAWLKSASPAQIESFKKAVKNGYLGLAALYDNELTGLCRPEELVALLGDANNLHCKYGILIDSAMISDVPGYTWGLVPILADSGIKYFSWGPNPSDHLGSARDFDNQAFWWVSPSGNKKVLVWQSNNGYQSAFNDDEASLVDYLTSFDKRFPNDPYDMICDRHTINDNGPIDPGLPKFVRDWNKKYAYPRLVISTNSHMFHDFDARYGRNLPTIKGDYTGYWEDGAASSAAETAINRDGAELAAQDEILWSMIDPARYPFGSFDDLWKNAVLYDEHTWGSYNSWSDPESDFSKSQWAWKRQYVLNVRDESQNLRNEALKIAASSRPTQTIAVFNTLSWPRTDLVTVSAEQSKAGDVVTDESGKAVPSQRLSNGSLAFIASNIPAMSSRKFRIMAGKSAYAGVAAASSKSLVASGVTLSFDQSNGDISGWTDGFDPLLQGQRELVNHSDLTCRGLNDYLYVLGDDNKAVAYAANATFTVIDSGPLVASLKVDSTAPGCTSLTRFYTVVDGLNEVLITDTLDKNIVHENEGVHLGFNFNVPNRVVRTDEPWSVVRPDIDQTEHANKSVYPVGRWVDVSNNEIGVTCANLDSPMMEIGAITQPRENDGGWLESSIQSSTIYWQVMNNYWHTNYKAYQAGLATFRYVVHPHASFDQAAVQRFGIGQSQPLIAVPIDAKKPDFQLPLKVSNVAVIVTACHPIPGGSAWMVRLFNSSNEPQTASVSWKTGTNLKCFQTNLWGNNDRPSRLQMNLSPMQIITLRLRPGIRGRNTVSNP